MEPAFKMVGAAMGFGDDTMAQGGQHTLIGLPGIGIADRTLAIDGWEYVP